MCENSEDKKLVPLSKFLVYKSLKQADIEDDIVEVSISGAKNTKIDANISNDDYIELVDDGSKYYYKPTKGQLKAKDLKVYYFKFCSNIATTKYMYGICCKDCYHTIKSKNSHKKVSSNNSISSNELDQSEESD
jgi:hypothetical protein